MAPRRSLEHVSVPLVDPNKGAPKRARDAGKRKQSTHVLATDNAAIFVDVDPASSATVRRHARVWSARSAEMMVRYFGAFPVPTLDLEIRKSGGGSVGFGQHFAGERVVIRAGSGTTVEDLRRDWVMPHEMFHTAFPSLDRRHRWMREGLSTYLESVIRAQAGVIDADTVWKRWEDRLPYGLPGKGEGGLDHTQSWGSTYWGGTLFWFLVDIRIREQTGNRRSLQDALVAILAEGGHARWEWPMKRVLRAGDKATGTNVFSTTYAEVAAEPYGGDLDAIFAKLGVTVAGGEVTYDDAAPWAQTRKAMLAPKYSLDALLPLR